MRFVRPIECLMREFVGSRELKSHHDVVVFLKTFDFAPELQVVKLLILTHEVDVGQFEFHPGIRGGATFRRC